MNVDLFIPCYMDQFYPEKAVNVLSVLKKLGVEVHYNIEQTCCGQLAFNSGNWKEAEQLAEKFLREYSSDRLLIAPSASCVQMVRQHYTRFFFNTSLHLELKSLQSRIYDFNDFLLNVLKLKEWSGFLNAKICFHDSCSMLRHYGMKDELRTLLKMIDGIQIVEMKDSEECCGFGGSFSVKYPEISIEMGMRKLNNAIDTGAEYLVSTEASCLLHLENLAKKHDINIKMATVADLLAMSIK